MRSLDSWLEEYGESHQNPLNKKLHWICVPVIYWCVFGLLHSVSPFLSGLGVIITTVFCLTLSRHLTAGLLVVNLFVLYSVWYMPNLLVISLVLFVLAWIGQFYGHHIEGKKPSFFKDLQFLLVGPIWILNSVYLSLGWKTKP